jgi:hypothetical protein
MKNDNNQGKAWSEMSTDEKFEYIYNAPLVEALKFYADKKSWKLRDKCDIESCHSVERYDLIDEMDRSNENTK